MLSQLQEAKAEREKEARAAESPDTSVQEARASALETGRIHPGGGALREEDQENVDKAKTLLAVSPSAGR